MGSRARCFPGRRKHIDYAFQFLLPVVRCVGLDTVAFGQYRLLWLGGGDGDGYRDDGEPGSHLLLPCRESRRDQTPLHQPGRSCFLAGLRPNRGVGGQLLESWLPEKMRDLAQHDAVVPLFVLLWLVASLSICCPRSRR